MNRRFSVVIRCKFLPPLAPDPSARPGNHCDMEVRRPCCNVLNMLPTELLLLVFVLSILLLAAAVALAFASALSAAFAAAAAAAGDAAVVGARSVLACSNSWLSSWFWWCL